LVAGFVLLPRLSERHAIIGLCVPYIGIGLTSSLGRGRASAPGNWVRVSGAALAAACALGFWSAGFENLWPNREVRRDPSASVVAWGNGFEKMLSINGIMGITMLVPETKMMAHLPLASLSRRPRNALVLCFGMGTTFRSALSWGIPVTVVELIPSVPELFGFFHPDGPRLLERPGARVVIDDARRFLDRSGETFDVITLDPAPPVTATGTSLLYSKEFYEAARRRLAPDGVLQTWCLFAESITVDSMAKALRESFPYVRAFRIGTRGGFHFLASGRPIPARDAKELAARLPLAAASDLMEWEHGGTPQAPFKRLLAQEGPIEWLARADSGVPALTDDRPVNEYFLLRWLGDRWHSRER
jgi:spermidine synthase